MQLTQSEALEAVLLNAHRVAVSLSELEVFRNTQLSVAEWAILKVLAGRQNVPVKEIVSVSGISRQRLRKLIAELESKGAVMTNRSEAEDKRARAISATPTAAKVLSLVSRQLEDLIAKPMGPKSDRMLANAARSMGGVANAIRAKLLGKRLLHAESRKSSKSESGVSEGAK